MASTGILSKTLHDITQTKLAEIAKQKAGFEKTKAEILSKANAASGVTSQLDKVSTLLDAHKQWTNLDGITPSSSDLHSNTALFLEQAKSDPAVTEHLLAKWEKQLLRELDIQSNKYEYAALYGKLVEEWLACSEDGTSFETVGRKEMHDQREIWEKYVFKAFDTSVPAINTFLDGIFKCDKAAIKQIEALRESTKTFEKQVVCDAFTEASLKWCIKGLLASDLLTDEKRSALNDFLDNKVVLAEIADILNMRMAALDSWSWGDDAITVEQRRHLNGRYRFYDDQDLLQLIFLRYIGVSWSVHFKERLTLIKQSSVWKSPRAMVSNKEKERRQFFGLSGFNDKGPVESERDDYYNEIFLEQLQSTAEENMRDYDNDDSSDTSDGCKSPQDLKQMALRLLASDIILKTRLGQDVTVIRSDFKWFGPSMPHSTIFAVLEYLGVSARWIDFFRRVLEMPMQFKNADGEDAPVQVRKRGTPISGPLSDVLGETVLFCLDLAVNSATDGARLWRLHDDIWFWGEEDTCVTAWKTMQHFASVMGLEYSEEKTGSVSIGKDRITLKNPSPSLPKGDVRWGFLKLDPMTGKFEIDQNMVDEHIAELKTQLKACKSVFDWIRAWNIYAARFFAVNFARSAECFGEDHVDGQITTFRRIQDALFANEKSQGVTSVTTKIQRMLSDRFGVSNIPEGYLYFPADMGGLDVKNPFVDLYLARKHVTAFPDQYMITFFEDEEAAYKRSKASWESRPVQRGMELKDREPFMSFEEYTRYREETSRRLGSVYHKLMSEASTAHVFATPEVKMALKHAEMSFESKSEYQQWIIQLYGEDIISRFGGLKVVDKGLLPTALVQMFRQSRFNWEG